MNAVWKYGFGDWQTGMLSLEMPEGAEILDIQIQDGEPVMWALVKPTNKRVIRHFLIIGTGYNFIGPGLDAYTGTFQWGEYVGHVFEVFQ